MYIITSVRCFEDWSLEDALGQGGNGTWTSSVLTLALNGRWNERSVCSEKYKEKFETYGREKMVDGGAPVADASCQQTFSPIGTCN